MARTAAKRILGTKLKTRKIKKSSGKTKIKIKVKASSPEKATDAIKKLAGEIGPQ